MKFKLLGFMTVQVALKHEALDSINIINPYIAFSCIYHFDMYLIYKTTSYTAPPRCRRKKLLFNESPLREAT